MLLDMSKFKVEYISGGRAWGYCPYHDDKHTPNLSITLNGKYSGGWRCWACGKKGKLSDTQTIVTLNRDKIDKSSQINWRRLQNHYVLQLDKLSLYKELLSKQLNISIYSISNFNIGYDGSAYTIPMYRGASVISGLQRRFSDGNKCSVKGSRLGIFHSPYGSYCEDGLLIICEGFSDTISIYDLGYSVIGIPFCGFDLKVLEDVLFDYTDVKDFENILIIPDNDDVGIKCANNIASWFGGEIFEFSGTKDIREYIKKKGKDSVIKELNLYV